MKLFIILLSIMSFNLFALDFPLTEKEMRQSHPQYFIAWGTCQSRVCNQNNYYNIYSNELNSKEKYLYIYVNKKLSYIQKKIDAKTSCYSVHYKNYINNQTCKTKIKNIDNFFIKANNEIATIY